VYLVQYADNLRTTVRDIGTLSFPISASQYRKSRGVSYFATTGDIYILTRSIIAYSDREGVENEMTDNLKVKASKAADDANVAAHAAYDDATVVVHNALKGAGVDAQNVSDDAKMGVHKAVSDAKIAVHKAGSDLKKK
jgi:hypothetical protein